MEISVSKKANSVIDAVLEKHNLKKTLLRRQILLSFMKAKGPITQAELINSILAITKSVDRVSIYRNLNQLKLAGVVHEVEVNNYVFCSHECSDHAHLLLFCQKCHRHQEIKDHSRIEKFMSTLNGFKFFGKQQPIFLRGICTSCTNS